MARGKRQGAICRGMSPYRTCTVRVTYKYSLPSSSRREGHILRSKGMRNEGCSMFAGISVRAVIRSPMSRPFVTSARRERVSRTSRRGGEAPPLRCRCRAAVLKVARAPQSAAHSDPDSRTPTTATSVHMHSLHWPKSRYCARASSGWALWNSDAAHICTETQAHASVPTSEAPLSFSLSSLCSSLPGASVAASVSPDPLLALYSVCHRVGPSPLGSSSLSVSTAVSSPESIAASASASASAGSSNMISMGPDVSPPSFQNAPCSSASLSARADSRGMLPCSVRWSSAD
jgi:hypothetical protein